MAHAPTLGPTVDMFLAVLAELRIRRGTAGFGHLRVIEIVVSGPQLVAELGLADYPHASLRLECLRRVTSPGLRR